MAASSVGVVGEAEGIVDAGEEIEEEEEATEAEEEVASPTTETSEVVLAGEVAVEISRTVRTEGRLTVFRTGTITIGAAIISSILFPRNRRLYRKARRRRLKRSSTIRSIALTIKGSSISLLSNRSSHPTISSTATPFNMAIKHLNHYNRKYRSKATTTSSKHSKHISNLHQAPT